MVAVSVEDGSAFVQSQSLQHMVDTLSSGIDSMLEGRASYLLNRLAFAFDDVSEIAHQKHFLFLKVFRSMLRNIFGTTVATRSSRETGAIWDWSILYVSDQPKGRPWIRLSFCRGVHHPVFVGTTVECAIWIACGIVFGRLASILFLTAWLDVVSSCCVH